MTTTSDSLTARAVEILSTNGSYNDRANILFRMIVQTIMEDHQRGLVRWDTLDHLFVPGIGERAGRIAHLYEHKNVVYSGSLGADQQALFSQRATWVPETDTNAHTRRANAWVLTRPTMTNTEINEPSTWRYISLFGNKDGQVHTVKASAPVIPSELLRAIELSATDLLEELTDIMGDNLSWNRDKTERLEERIHDFRGIGDVASVLLCYPGTR